MFPRIYPCFTKIGVNCKTFVAPIFIHRELLGQYLIGKLPEEEHEVVSNNNNNNELAFPEQRNLMLVAVPLVLGFIAMVTWKYRNLLFGEA